VYYLSVLGGKHLQRLHVQHSTVFTVGTHFTGMMVFLTVTNSQGRNLNEVRDVRSSPILADPTNHAKFSFGLAQDDSSSWAEFFKSGK